MFVVDQVAQGVALLSILMRLLMVLVDHASEGGLSSIDLFILKIILVLVVISLIISAKYFVLLLHHLHQGIILVVLTHLVLPLATFHTILLVCLFRIVPPLVIACCIRTGLLR